ncbi:MAG: HD domain-containing protein [Bacteroidales bacterium]|nr:HD domain-containing protein [Bacteroidales bacterium]
MSEEEQVQQKYHELVEACNAIQPMSAEEENALYRAFSLAHTAHAGVRRKSGELYIFHPLAVAQIAVGEVGLGSTAAVCALLHDVVEDTEVTLEDLRSIFGDRVSRIVDGVTKIDKVTLMASKGGSFSPQAENYRKILLAMCEDAYVIFLKLCDRLHNMRTLGSMKDTKKLAISAETEYLYIPLAHRLGLYAIKTELEDLVMQYTNPVAYEEIQTEINRTAGTEQKLRTCFTTPLCQLLNTDWLGGTGLVRSEGTNTRDTSHFTMTNPATGHAYTIKTRVKSVYSCWKKMQNKGVQFKEIFDLYAMRIILDLPETRGMDPEKAHKVEQEECEKVRRLVTSKYGEFMERRRDWIDKPKTNGYESLHVTVMSPIGQWVEVQIRTARMDVIAERGMAAHFLYKESHPDEVQRHNPVEDWLLQIRSALENSEKNALDVVEEFKESLYTKEIYVFTPRGKTITMRAGSTVLDFAFQIHSDLGMHCLGAKVNARVVPIDYKLHSGEQVQVLTSHNSHPTEEWLNIAVTARAKDHIKDWLRDMKKSYYNQGHHQLQEFMQRQGLEETHERYARLSHYFNVSNKTELFYRIATGAITDADLMECYHLSSTSPEFFFVDDDKATTGRSKRKALLSDKPRTVSPFLIDDEYSNLDCSPAPCCKPVQGDKLVGIVTDGHIMVHRTNCPNAIHEMASHEDHIVRTRWRPGEKIVFLTGVSITAIDRKGVLQDLMRIISEEMDLNIRSITFEASEGVGRGIIMLYVSNLNDLYHLMSRIETIDGVEQVQRI